MSAQRGVGTGPGGSGSGYVGDNVAAPVSGPPAEASPWNVANAVTVLRIGLVPVFAWLLLSGGDDPRWRLGAFTVFLVAILTDRVDGEIARKRGLVTTFGKIADPIADKALTGMGFVGLSLLGELSWWVTGVVLGREWLVTLVRLLVIRHGVIAASRGGKLKTVLQAVALCGYLLAVDDVLHAAAALAMAAAVVVTVVTGVEYVVQAVHVRREGRQAGR
ncbi:MAG: CDP-diacylglycerol--glycerol-3-phosphate 3-phosphatidyltransferase [Actinomycetota bacterium]|nr:CDP-diacylglycerol--glycerol-3-phosphate 3-phosphatidyltransferase [Actinomycetota bacterium]